MCCHLQLLTRRQRSRKCRNWSPSPCVTVVIFPSHITFPMTFKYLAIMPCLHTNWTDVDSLEMLCPLFSIFLNYPDNRQCWLVAWLVVDYLLLRNLWPCGIIFINVCVVVTVAMDMMLRDSRPYGIIFMTMCVYYFRFSHRS
jgi:hypothetical protein